MKGVRGTRRCGCGWRVCVRMNELFMVDNELFMVDDEWINGWRLGEGYIYDEGRGAGKKESILV